MYTVHGIGVNKLRVLCLIVSLFCSFTAAQAQQSAEPPVAPPVAPPDLPAPDAIATPHETPPPIATPNDLKGAQDETSHDDDAWVPGTNWWGARGMQRVDSAHAARTKSLVFGLSTDYSRAQQIFFPGDLNVIQKQRLVLFWSPLPGLEFGLIEQLIVDNYSINSGFLTRTITALGNPVLNVKYSLPIRTDLGVGVHSSLLIPNAVRSNGLVPRAFVLSAHALATYQVAHFLELSANLGFVLDQSRHLAVDTTSPHVRFAYNISNYSGGAFGLGAMGRIDIAETIGLGPFVELTGQISKGLGFHEDPIIATGGLKTYLAGSHFLELSLSVDARVSGKPIPGRLYPGVMPLTGFAMLSMHLFDHPEPREVRIGPTPCNVDADCGPGQTCHERNCVITTQVITEVVKVKEVQTDTFTISGTVLDAATKRPVVDAVVTIVGFEKTPLTVDYKTGNFHSFPLNVGDGLIQLRASAPNYKINEQTIARSKKSEDRLLPLTMERADKPAIGKIEGTFKDARTGAPIPKGTVFIIALGQKVIADSKGAFSAMVRAGRYDVLMSAPLHATQRKKIIIHDGDVIILNVDLQKKHP